jgi:tRNA-dependent cyclodipeptide synthase
MLKTKDLDQKAFVRATFRHNPKNSKEIYLESRVILLISIGQAYHEGEKLDAIIDLINRSCFKKCFIMLGDSIQRFNLAVQNGYSLEKAHILARSFGDEWLKRNQSIYEKLKMSYEIIRWDTWLNHPDYKKCLTEVNNLYSSNDLVKQSFHNSMNQFLLRQRGGVLNQNEDGLLSNRETNLYLNYLKEECAIIMPLWAKETYDFIAYPSKILDAMQATYDHLVKPFYSKEFILYWLSMRFKKKKVPCEVEVF